MSKRVLLIVVLVSGIMTLASGQDMTGRIRTIKIKLDSLAATTAPGLNQAADLSFSNISIQNFLRTVAESHSLNVQVDPALDIKVTTNFTSVLVKDVMIFLCDNYGLDIKFVNNIMYVARYVEPKVIEKKVFIPYQIRVSYQPAGELLSLDLRNDTLVSVIRKITRESGKNVILSSEKLNNRIINCFIQSAPLESALDKMALGNGMSLRKTQDGFFVLQDAAPAGIQGGVDARGSVRTMGNDTDGQFKITLRDSVFSMEAFNAPIVDIIKQAADKLKIEYIVTGNISGNTSLSIRRITFDQLLEYLFRTTSYTFRKNKDIYIIGERIQEGLRKVEVVRMEFRAVDGVEKEIPTELAKGVEIKVFKELNSLILSGSPPVIEEIKRFLMSLDKPVPNILIELVVIDLKKGFSIQTGLAAFLGDSTKKTGGQALGKVDLTLSSATINNALRNLTNNGVINLGQVSPNFYMTLKALEDNSNIDIRSTPKLSTMNGHEATLTIGRSQYYIEQTQNITGGVTPITTTAQRFNKVEANLNISIKPAVSGNEHITLDLEAEFSDFIPSTIVNAPPGNSTRKFKSKIRVKNGETLLFGGLEQETQSQTSSGVPLLARVPVIKWLFSSRSRAKQRDQLIILIKPTVVY